MSLRDGQRIISSYSTAFKECKIFHPVEDRWEGHAYALLHGDRTAYIIASQMHSFSSDHLGGRLTKSSVGDDD